MRKTIELSEYAASDRLVRDAMLRAEQIDWLARYLQECGEESRVKLDKLMQEKFGFNATSASSLLEWFESYGWVKAEVRAEEIITREVCTYADVIQRNDDKTFTIKDCYCGKLHTVHDITVDTKNGNLWVEGKHSIQVRRKYYKWVA